MYQIKPWLFLGKYRETLDTRLLSNNKIEAILTFAEPVINLQIPILYLPLEDGLPVESKLLKQGLDFIQTHHTAGKNILVACGAGISRSAGLIVAALKEMDNSTLLAAYSQVLKVQPGALPHPAI